MNFQDIPDEERKLIYNRISQVTKMPPYAVEKDWWVVQTLSILFNMEVGKEIVFKGGTSLSKVWDLIDRFSEDIDLAINRSFFGFDDELSKKQISKLRKKSSKYISEIFAPQLEEKFKEKGFNQVSFKVVESSNSDQDPRIVEIYYPALFNESLYIKPKVQVEIGCRSLIEPKHNTHISSLVDVHFANEKFTRAPIVVPTVDPTRTFLEKLFLLHEEFQRPTEKIRTGNRLSRHLYDIYKIIETQYAEAAIKNKQLYQTIVKHRHSFSKLGGVDYNNHNPISIHPFPPDNLMDSWKKDYKSMQESMIYGSSPSYDEMVTQIKYFTEKMKDLDWNWDLQF